MKRKLSIAARLKMAAGGRKASRTVKSNAGKKGFEALIAKTVAQTIKEISPA